MKLDGIGNAKRGIRHGLINQIVSLVFPFFIQTLMIHQLGVAYVGIKGLFSSILTVFSLAELGIGDAIVYAMYKPIAEDDYGTICALLNYYRKVYRNIGLVITILGVATIPFLSFFVKGKYPDELCIEFVFSLYLINTVLSYWLYSYRISLLIAYQRTDINSIINTITRLITFFIQIFVLIILKDFYIFLVISIVSTIINNLMIKVITERVFPDIVCVGDVDENVLRSVKKSVSGIMISRICGTTRNTFDSIFISRFVGLDQTALYSNYYYVIIALNGFAAVIMSSLLGGVGNSVALNEKKKNYNDMIKINNIYLVLSGMMTAMMLCLYQPFMNIWMGKDFLFANHIMILFPIYFYISKMGDIRWVYSEAAGLFWEDRRRCIIEAIANLLLNYLLGKYFGVIGILLATIITLFSIGFIGSTIVIFKYYFKEGIEKYLKNQTILLLGTVFVCIISYVICGFFFEDYNMICIIPRGIIVVIVGALGYWGLFSRSSQFGEAKELIIRILKKGSGN